MRSCFICIGFESLIVSRCFQNNFAAFFHTYSRKPDLIWCHFVTLPLFNIFHMTVHLCVCLCFVRVFEMFWLTVYNPLHWSSALYAAAKVPSLWKHFEIEIRWWRRQRRKTTTKKKMPHPFKYGFKNMVFPLHIFK